MTIGLRLNLIILSLVVQCIAINILMHKKSVTPRIKKSPRKISQCFNIGYAEYKILRRILYFMVHLSLLDDEYKVFLTENDFDMIINPTYDKVTMQKSLLLTVIDILEVVSNDVDIMRKSRN